MRPLRNVLLITKNVFYQAHDERMKKMSIWQKIRMGLTRFMLGRHGVDHLGMFTLVTGLLISLAGSIFGVFLLSFTGFLLYIITVFRMLSRNHEARMKENRKYIDLTSEGFKNYYTVLQLLYSRSCSRCHANHMHGLFHGPASLR